MTNTTLPSKKQIEHPGFLSSAQDVANYVANYLRGIAEELSVHSCEHVKTPCGETRLSGYIMQRDTRSFTDWNNIAREIFLHLGFAALGSVHAVATTALVRSEIWHLLNLSLPPGALSENGQIFYVTMRDGHFRLKSVADDTRAVLHVRAVYKPALLGTR